MNILALRRTQLSIADETRIFDMGCWCCCIAGHAVRANGAEEACDTETQARQLLGLTLDEGLSLFYESHWGLGFGGLKTATRADAIRVIDDLIARHVDGTVPWAQVRIAKAPERRLNNAETPTAETAEELELVGV